MCKFWQVKDKLNMKKVKETFSESIMAVVLSQIIVKILGLVYKLYLTNRKSFGDEGNAYLGVSFQIYAIMLSITSIGIPSAISNLVAKKTSVGDHRNANKIFKVALVLFSIIGLVGSIILFQLSTKIAENYLHIKEASISIIALSPSIFIVSIISVFKGYFTGRERIKYVAFSQTIDQTAKTISTIVLIEITSKVLSTENTEIFAAIASFGTTIGNVFELITLIRKYFEDLPEIKKEIILSVNTSEVSLKDISKWIIEYALPISISALISTISRNVDSFTIVNGLTNIIGYKEAKIEYGILSGKIETLINLPLAFNMAISNALLPTVSANYNMLSKAKKRITKTFLLEMILSIISMFGYVIFANKILKLLFPNASSGAALLRISAFSILFITIEQIISGMLHSIGKTTIIIKATIMESIVKILLNIILVPKVNFILGGAKGAAFSTLISHILIDIILMTSLIKETKIHFNLKHITRNFREAI